MDDEDAAGDLSTFGLPGFAPYLMNRVMHRYNQTLMAKMNAIGLSVTKMRALAALAAQGGLTVNQLTVYAVTEQSTMSRTLDQMERAGLVVRRVRESDSRARHVTLTDAGWDAYREIWPEMRKAERTMFKNVAEEDYRVLLQVLNQMLDNIRVHRFRAFAGADTQNHGIDIKPTFSMTIPSNILSAAPDSPVRRFP